MLTDVKVKITKVQEITSAKLPRPIYEQVMTKGKVVDGNTVYELVQE